MEIGIELTRKDFQEFYRYVLTKKQLNRKYNFSSYIILALFFLLVNITKLTDLSYMAIQLVIFALIVFIVNFFSNHLNIFLSKSIPLDKGGTLGKHKFTITKEGLIESTETSQNLLKWQGIQSVETNEKYIFVFIDRHSAHIIPKRYFSSDTDCVNFIQALNNKGVLWEEKGVMLI